MASLATATKTSQRDGDAMPPFSLELLTKKREILSSEVAKLEECLRQRTQFMHKLRHTLDALLVNNGDLEECARLRETNLQNVRMALAATADAINSRDTSQAAADLSSGIETRRLCEALLVSMHVKRAQHETACMESEEGLQRQVESWMETRETYRLASEQAEMMIEDTRTVAMALQFEQTATRDAEEKMIFSSNTLERENLSTNDTNSRLNKVSAQLTDLRISIDSANGMLEEDLRVLRERKQKTEKDVRLVEDLLRKAGAALPEDFELEETARLLSQRLEKLTVGISEATFSKRDAVLRRKEEADLLSVTKSNVASREDQLKWLERQLSHLIREHSGLLSAREADKEAYNVFKVAHDDQMESITQYVASISDESAKIVEQAALAHANLSSGRTDFAARTALLHSKRELQAKKVVEAELVQSENRKAEGDICRAKESLNKLETRQNELVLNADRLGMSCEDELSTQQRYAGATDTLKKNSKTIEGLHLNAINAVKEKFAKIGSDFSQDASRGNAEQLLDIVVAKANNKREKEAYEFITKQSESKARLDALETRYDGLMVLLRARYAEAIDSKRQEHEILLRDLSSKDAATKAQLELSTISEGANTIHILSVEKPRGSSPKTRGKSGRSNLKSSASLTSHKARPLSGPSKRQTSEDVRHGNQDSNVNATETPDPNIDQLFERRSDKPQPGCSSPSHLATLRHVDKCFPSPPHSALRRQAGKCDLVMENKQALSPEEQESRESTSLSCRPQVELQQQRKERQQSAAVPKVKAKTRKSLPKVPKKSPITQPNRAHHLAPPSKDALLVQSKLEEDDKSARTHPLLSSSVIHLKGAVGEATKANQKSKSIYRTMPKPNGAKPITKAARPPTTSKAKARKSSQTVDWLADDSFSFS